MRRWHGGRSRRVIGAALLVMITPACAQESSLPESPPRVTVAMREYRFDTDTSLPAGRVVVSLRNEGQLNHQMSLVKLAEDVPPLAEQLRSPTRRGAPSIALLYRPPGASTVFALDLTRGRYGMLCFVADPDGVQHATKGMFAEIHVR